MKLIFILTIVILSTIIILLLKWLSDKSWEVKKLERDREKLANQSSKMLYQVLAMQDYIEKTSKAQANDSPSRISSRA